ncbi:hypothetical protein BDZ89DRAFT_1057174 [Hymenopellis radicata]|nr:hypothetical protein BDZ89DRAFT_1057174 [Hymenopellis radicata]
MGAKSTRRRCRSTTGSYRQQAGMYEEGPKSQDTLCVIYRYVSSHQHYAALLTPFWASARATRPSSKETLRPSTINTLFLSPYAWKARRIRLSQELPVQRKKRASRRRREEARSLDHRRQEEDDERDVCCHHRR